MPDALDWEERGVRIEEEEEADRDVDWGRKRPDSSGRALMVCRFTEFSGETKRQSGERKSESITEASTIYTQFVQCKQDVFASYWWNQAHE
jgi:hypothetical protein